MEAKESPSNHSQQPRWTHATNVRKKKEATTKNTQWIKGLLLAFCLYPQGPSLLVGRRRRRRAARRTAPCSRSRTHGPAGTSANAPPFDQFTKPPSIETSPNLLRFAPARRRRPGRSIPPRPRMSEAKGRKRGVRERTKPAGSAGCAGSFGQPLPDVPNP